jgi:hypothetical protein
MYDENGVLVVRQSEDERHTIRAKEERRMNIKGVLLTLIVLLSCIGCGSTGGGKPSPTTNTTKPVTVELDVYSGRPNPTWILSTQEIPELAHRLLGLSSLPTVPSVGNLGYRGFLLHNPGNVSGIGAEVRVYKGVIIITDQGHTSAYKDSHELEQWLVEQARAHGEGATLKAIGK